MSLEIKINDDIKAAMLNKDKRSLEALRAIKAALLLIKTGKDTSDGDIPESLEISTLQRLVKQRRESAEIYKSQGRDDLLEEEIFQLKIIETYLPQQMSEEDVKQKLQEIMTNLGASSMKDMGKVMGEAQKEFAGKADNKVVSSLVKELLG